MSSGGHSQFGKSMKANGYEKPAVVEVYDEWYSSPICFAENHAISRVFGSYCDGAVVCDLGAGTGLVNSLTIPSSYVAVDASGDMLERLAATDHEVFTVKADLTTEDGRHFVRQTVKYLGVVDVVTALFAGHSFASQSLYNTIFEMLPSKGTIMFHGNLPRRRFRKPPPTLDIEGEYDYSFTSRSMVDGLLEAGFEDVRVVGCNALPDFIARRLGTKLLSRIIYFTRLIPARYHYHAVAIGRKP